jgi:hypothetical protein
MLRFRAGQPSQTGVRFGLRILHFRPVQLMSVHFPSAGDVAGLAGHVVGALGTEERRDGDKLVW